MNPNDLDPNLFETEYDFVNHVLLVYDKETGDLIDEIPMDEDEEDRREDDKERNEKENDKEKKPEDEKEPREEKPDQEGDKEQSSEGEGEPGEAGEAGEMGEASELGEAGELGELGELAEGAELLEAGELAEAGLEGAGLVGGAGGAAGAAGTAAGGTAAAATSEVWVPIAIAVAAIIVVVLAVVVIFALMGASPDQASGSPNQASGSTSQTVICVDPGHPSELGSSSTQADYDRDKASWERNKTGANSGTSGNGAEERVINQQVADLLVAELKSRKYDAVETKTNSETFMTNRDRGKFCKSKSASLIVKIHNDDGSGFNGMAFWYPNKGIIKQKSSNPGGFNEYPWKTSDTTFSNDIKVKDSMSKAFIEGQKKYGYTYKSTTKDGSGNNNDGFGYVYDLPTTLIEMSSMPQSSGLFIKNTDNQKNIVKAFADGIENFVPASTGGVAINGVIDVPYWNQFRNSQTSCTGGKTWATTGTVGCGATSEAMVARFLLKDDKITPDFVNQTINGTGDHWDMYALNTYLKKKGLKVQYSNGKYSDPEAALKDIEKSIAKGYPAVVHMNPPYACSTHIMVVTGFDSNGNVYVNDPNCGDCGTGVHNESNQYMKVGKPVGKNDLAPRAKFKAAFRFYNIIY